MMEIKSYGSPQNTPIVFIHGFPDIAETWISLVDELKPDFYCLCPEIYPAKISGKVPGLQARSLELLQSLEKMGVQKFHLIGHDLGAPLAWRIAELSQDRCLSLTMMGGMSVQQMAQRLARNPRQRKMSWYLPLMNIPGVPEVASKIFFAQIERLIRRQGRRPMDISKEGLKRFGLYREYLKDLFFKSREKVSCPLILLWGAEDAYVLPPQKEEFDSCADSVFTQIFEGGHWFYLENPQGVAQCLRQQYQEA